tara:strand:- start:115 stop:396 length:282 start_codon:yes stop_codon:yes gene_type:complete
MKMTNAEKIENIRSNMYEANEGLEALAEQLGEENKLVKLVKRVVDWAMKINARRIALLQLEEPNAPVRFTVPNSVKVAVMTALVFLAIQMGGL